MEKEASDLQPDPSLQNPPAAELTQQPRPRDAEGAVGLRPAATRHAAEEVVLQLPEEPGAARQWHRLQRIMGRFVSEFVFLALTINK